VPELPDVTVYVERLRARVVGQPLERVRLATPFLLRTVDPPLSATFGREVREVRRLGKRIVLGVEGELFLVLHLMIAGRLRWRERGAAVTRKVGLAAFDFPVGSVLLSEAATKKRASLHIVRAEGLRAFDKGGIEPLEASLEDFRNALLSENHTLKRALTDPRLFSGIGNAYSDEILFSAGLSPITRVQKLNDAEIERLFQATRGTLERWTDELRREVGEGFPEKVTAFREAMAVHGRYGKPCRVCGTRVQRIRYADNEVNYCPRCQTAGRLLADRALSRLLHEDWPRTIEELEAAEEQRSSAVTPPGTRDERKREKARKARR